MLFIGTFFICLFIFMMQFLWRYVDELVGKGLEMSVLAQFFFYSALTLIPLSLPLAILLAALMTFGNFGERYELLSMKAAGIPLLRIIRPLVFFCLFLSCISFYFQNVVAPKAQMKLWTLLVSMKQTSPELDIPEGVFYDEIEGYNIYVKQKDRKTGMLKDILIYNFSDGFENAHIIWASEGKMEMTADKQHLYLHLYNGEQFENLKSQSISSNNVPYRRETFREKHTIIEFDGGFNMVDDSLFSSYTLSEKDKTLGNAAERAESLASEWNMKSYPTTDVDNNIRKHKADWHKKITLSLSCMIFFFIGAPLGAIIRKGGLGMPVVISVLIFVIYYIIDSGATRVAKSGEMDMVLGVWMSTLVLAPLGAFFTYKSNNDSVVFNAEVYINFFRMLLGLRPSRHVFKKEVIIEDPDYPNILARLDDLCNECQIYDTEHKLSGAPNYYRIFTNSGHDDKIAKISEKMEHLIEELSNSKDGTLLNFMNKYPILSTKAHKSPFDNRWLNLPAGLIFPIGVFFYFRIWRFRLRLDKDLKNIIKTSREIQDRIKNESFII